MTVYKICTVGAIYSISNARSVVGELDYFRMSMKLIGL
jgi:hypothetical protein